MKIEKIYLDMDGVLADFDQHFENLYDMTARDFENKYGQVRFWEKVYEAPRFFQEMPPMEKFLGVIRLSQQLCNSVIILSSPSKTNQPLCMIQKRAWVDMHIGEDFPAIFESAKHKYAGPGRVLIDDSPDKCTAWAEQGGIAHLYTTYSNFKEFMETLNEIKAYKSYDK